MFKINRLIHMQEGPAHIFTRANPWQTPGWPLPVRLDAMPYSELKMTRYNPWIGQTWRTALFWAKAGWPIRRYGWENRQIVWRNGLYDGENLFTPTDEDLFVEDWMIGGNGEEGEGDPGPTPELKLTLINQEGGTAKIGIQRVNMPHTQEITLHIGDVARKSTASTEFITFMDDITVWAEVTLKELVISNSIELLFPVTATLGPSVNVIIGETGRIPITWSPEGARRPFTVSGPKPVSVTEDYLEVDIPGTYTITLKTGHSSSADLVGQSGYILSFEDFTNANFYTMKPEFISLDGEDITDAWTPGGYSSYGANGRIRLPKNRGTLYVRGVGLCNAEMLRGIKVKLAAGTWGSGRNRFKNFDGIFEPGSCGNLTVRNAEGEFSYSTMKEIPWEYLRCITATIRDNMFSFAKLPAGFGPEVFQYTGDTVTSAKGLFLGATRDDPWPKDMLKYLPNLINLDRGFESTTVTEMVLPNNTQSLVEAFKKTGLTQLPVMPKSIVNLTGAFRELTSSGITIPPGYLFGCDKLEKVAYAFYKSNITGNMPRITDTVVAKRVSLDGLLGYNLFTSIDEDFFKFETSATSGRELLRSSKCQWPVTLLHPLVNMKDLGYAFYSVEIPDFPVVFFKLPSVVNIEYMLGGCKDMTLRAGIFDEMISVTNIGGLFRSAKNLKIPGALFRYMTKVTTLPNVFASSTFDMIPEDTFRPLKIVSASYLFSEATGTIPKGLLAHCDDIDVTRVCDGMGEGSVVLGFLPKRVKRAYAAFSGNQGDIRRALEGVEEINEISDLVSECVNPIIDDDFFGSITITGATKGVFKNSRLKVPSGLMDNLKCGNISYFFEDTCHLQFPRGILDKFDKNNPGSVINGAFWIYSPVNGLGVRRNINDMFPLTKYSFRSVVSTFKDDRNTQLVIGQAEPFIAANTSATATSGCFKGNTRLDDYGSIPNSWK